MAGLTLPYKIDTSTDAHGGDPYACTLFKMLPKKMQASTKDHVYLLEYLHGIPVNKVGIPEYYTELSGKLKDKKKLNLIYPVEGGLYIHIMDDPEGGRGFYIAVEPTIGSEEGERKLMREIENWLLDYAMEFEGAETDQEKKEVLERLLDTLNSENTSGATSSKS